MIEFFIPGNVPSSKNAKQWTGKFLVSSASTKKYERNAMKLYKLLAPQFRRAVDGLPKPLVVEFEFVRDSRRKFDYINPAQTVQDFMVKSGWIDDDSVDYIIPCFKKYWIDKNNAGVYIRVYEDMERDKKL